MQLKLHWGRAIGLGAVLISTAGAFVAVVVLVCLGECQWKHVLVGAVSYILPGLGVTVYLHRYLTHGTFRFTRRGAWTLQPLLHVAANAALQSAALNWVQWHRQHHEHSDREDDPHSPTHGFWWSHVGWIGYVPSPDREASYRLPRVNGIVRFLSQAWAYLVFGPVLALVLAYLMAGWQGPLWYLAAVGVLWHVTSAVNSVCHQHPRGYRHDGRDTGDLSTNNLVLGVVGFGEGWHHNHHQSQRSAKFSRRWWELDVGYDFIRLMQRARLVRNVSLASP